MTIGRSTRTYYTPRLYPNIQYRGRLFALVTIWVLILLIAVGCISPDDPETFATSAITPTAPPTRVIPLLPPGIVTIIPTAGPTPTAIINQYASGQGLPDYSQMVNVVNTMIADVHYDVGVGFVDIVTGQAVAMGREGRFHAMSTFKGPLAAYYLWLIEQGKISEGPGDENQINRMLEWSSNTSTTCVIGLVGGLEGFNDWLAAQGMSRKGNFVYSWAGWICATKDGGYAALDDRRYRFGDPQLGLPGEGRLLFCPSKDLPCDAALTPLDLAVFYARMYRGEILNPADTVRWLQWMEKPLSVTSIFDSLPDDMQDRVHAYTKNGFHPSEKNYRVNFYHDAGILVTPYGAFTLAVFMDKNPEWRGTDIHGEIGRIVFDAFTQAHGRP
jgi:beta-lactamase family protein